MKNAPIKKRLRYDDQPSITRWLCPAEPAIVPATTIQNADESEGSFSLELFDPEPDQQLVVQL